MWSRFGRALDAASTRAWSAGFQILSALPASPVRRWRSTGAARVLVVAPHPDDEVAGCGGTILLHRAAGDHVTVLHVTDGRGSRALGLGPEAMAERRHTEAKGSIEVSAVNRWEWLGLHESEWSDADLAGPLEVLLRDLDPQVIYAPSRVDFHPEHTRVAGVLARSPELLAHRDAVVRIYQVQVPLTRVLVNLVAPIGEVWAGARTAAAAYESQAETLRSTWRLKRYAAAHHGHHTAAEEFWELSPREYAALHEPAPPSGSESFRGLRRLAMLDPLAFAHARTARHRLHTQAVERARASARG